MQAHCLSVDSNFSRMVLLAENVHVGFSLIIFNSNVVNKRINSIGCCFLDRFQGPYLLVLRFFLLQKTIYRHLRVSPSQQPSYSPHLSDTPELA